MYHLEQMLQDEEKKKLEKKEQEEYERNVEKGVFPATKKAPRSLILAISTCL